MVRALLRAYVPSAMKRTWLPWLIALVFAPGFAIQSLGVADAPSPTETRPLTDHLGVVLSRMDPGPRSREYRESLAYLRLHAAEAVSELSGPLLSEPGSFRKWQLTYLLGELGDESAVALLRTFMNEPMPQPRPAPEGSHQTDLRYSEESASRVQAVTSTARIASRRPELRDQVIDSLIAAAQRSPRLEATAMFELRALMGSDFQSLRGVFGPESARHFEPFMPPAEWQGLLSRRMQKHRRVHDERRQKRKPLCRAN